MNQDMDMLVVIQCAAGKNESAGHFMSDDGRKILFVADPDLAPAGASIAYRRPDDPANDLASPGRSYRDALIAYNRERREENPFGLLPALDLYRDEAYGGLAGKFGRERVFILSAGWGLISADFLTPNYDITFSNSAKGADAYKHRLWRRDSVYRDFCMIPEETSSHVVFLGGKDYIPLFCKTTAGIARRTIFHKTALPPDVPGCEVRRYETTAKMRWYYECAKELISGSLCL